MGIGKKLNVLLKQRGMTVNELSTRIRVVPMTIYSVIKRDSTKMDINMLTDIAKELEVPLEYFSDRYTEVVPDIYIGKEKQLVSEYRRLSNLDKSMINWMIKGFLEQYEAEVKKEKDLSK